MKVKEYMKFLNLSEFNQQTEVNSSGSSYTGFIEVDYKQLVEIFGYPSKHNIDMDKTDAEWFILFEDGTTATIYNYKDGKNYCGDSGTPTKEINSWHVGGKADSSIINVQKVIRDYRQKQKDLNASFKFPTQNYSVALLDKSEVTLKQIDELSSIAIIPVDGFLLQNVKKELCEYENNRENS